jgi:glutamate racemase
LKESTPPFESPAFVMTRAPKIFVFDSGLGGLTVFAEIAKIRPSAEFVYCADDAGFPYGSWGERELVARIVSVLEPLIEQQRPDVVVIACNTASTLALPQLRARWPELLFVGTVPAIKPAAAMSRTGLISVLATPGTVARDYTQKLIQEFANGCSVTLVGSKSLARLAEAAMHGEEVAESAIAAEIAPCFVRREGARTDVIVLACTHYPLLLEAFARLAPWPVDWIDPAPAIARRADQVLAENFGPDAPNGDPPRRRSIFTSAAAPSDSLAATLDRYGLPAA